MMLKSIRLLTPYLLRRGVLIFFQDLMGTAAPEVLYPNSMVAKNGPCLSQPQNLSLI